MEIRALTVEKREGTGKEVAKRLRRAGRVPAVLYGGTAPVNITVNPKDVFRLIHGHEGGTQLLQVSFGESTDKRMAIIRDMQFDPVSEDLVHVDLQEVAMDKPIQVTVPLRHEGEPIGVRETKGILEMILREVQVSCLPSQIPESFTADVSPLEIGDVFTVGQLPVPGGVRILTDPNQAVATVAPPMAEEEVAVAPVAGVVAATPAEPEVLTERKPKEEAVDDKEKDKDAKKK
jgi:large subunit ribosomal protein L25